MSAPPIVYVTSGIFGYLYRFLPIGRELAERGRRIVIVTASAEAISHAAAAGFETRHLPRQETALAKLDSPNWPSPLNKVTSRIPGVSLGPRRPARTVAEARRAILADTAELLAVLDELDPALVLTEPEEHRDIRAVSSTGRPIALIEDLYSVRPGPDVPFPGRNHAAPDGSTASRARAFAGWQRFLVLERIRQAAERAWVGGNDWHSTLAAVGQPDTDRRYFQFYDYTAIPRVRTIAPELAYPGEPQPPTITGPIVDVDRVVHDVDEGFAERWATMTADRAGRQLVYISLGTFLAGLDDLVTQVVTVAAEVPTTHVLVSVGRDIDRWHGRQVPDNVAVFGRVPQLAVLAAADLCISTGGLNTGHEALWFGVPVLNIVVGGVDAAGNASRLTYHGVARHLAKQDLTTEVLRTEIHTLLTDDGYRDRAAAMGAKLQAWNGIQNAADEIEALVS